MAKSNITAVFRRSLAIVTWASTLMLVAVGIGFLYSQFATDHFRIIHWYPVQRAYTETLIIHDASGFTVHTESTVALPSDDSSALLAPLAGKSCRVLHASHPGMGGGGPILWGDHYRATPSIGINTNGLSDCWHLHFRHEVALFVFAILPGIWACRRMWRWFERRAFDRRGFAVVPDPACNDHL